MSWEMCFTICCSTFFQPTGRRRDRSRLLPRNPPKRQHPPRPPISQEMRNEQAECPLFSPNFPAELRLSIYEAVLGDQHRLMHVIPFDDHYLEAINVMYTANKFSVKGARGIEAFHSVTPQPQWHQIRHLNISTIFLTPRQYYPEHEWFPPDNYVQWPTSCAIVQSLHGLRSLQVELIVRDTHDRKNETLVEEEALFSILKPLTLVSAPLFEVEINMAVPETVLKKLGELTFTLVVKYKPYEHSLFSAL
ncbi:hypothetical protein SNOG_13198 [Parastagonospora nodorum SN15]|uniref:DUF7730 domain-containing protein n=1 Tax=Phaeosphaeria nodorum (strain SN15 / ATCC MYA-4574 / FGSC 10173) TaxID=321614 RepID=Q0U4W6_PHANO|nr:hypothetical protein SNOG_13198 [Parastagonospora nodorum SN15]EAT79525.1 hypothetical protein SNOG_13198 [Parastagonospora nodorum SN15]